MQGLTRQFTQGCQLVLMVRLVTIPKGTIPLPMNGQLHISPCLAMLFWMIHQVPIRPFLPIRLDFIQSTLFYQGKTTFLLLSQNPHETQIHDIGYKNNIFYIIYDL